MSGNLIKFRGKIYKIVSVTLETADIEHIEPSGIIQIFRNIDIRTIEDIPLSDELFTSNGYKFNSKSELFTAGDGFGPAIRKRTLDCYFDSDKIEYSVAGIIVRTVDEFQNLMNVMHCERIADKITV